MCRFGAWGGSNLMQKPDCLGRGHYIFPICGESNNAIFMVVFPGLCYHLLILIVCCLSMRCIGTPYHPFSSPWKIRVFIPFIDPEWDPRIFFGGNCPRFQCALLISAVSAEFLAGWGVGDWRRMTTMAPISMWAMKKPELFRVYRGLYYTVKWGLW